MQDAFNAQIQREFYSSNLYLAMAAFFQSSNLNGFANWMRIQAQEEMTHALKFFDYLLQRGGEPKIGEIQAPPSKWDSALHCFEEALTHERYITENIGELANKAIQEGDHASLILLQWFINEQVEEEATSSEIVDRLRLAGESKSSLFFLDAELKQRKFTPEASAK